MLVQTRLRASLGVIIRQWFMCGSPMFGAFPLQSRVHFASYVPLKKKRKLITRQQHLHVAVLFFGRGPRVYRTVATRECTSWGCNFDSWTCNNNLYYKYKRDAAPYSYSHFLPFRWKRTYVLMLRHPCVGTAL